MKITLKSAFQGVATGAVVEVSDSDGADLIQKGIGEKIVEQKEIVVSKSMPKPEYLIGRALQGLSGKAVTGMSEGTAADGGAVIATAVSEIMGIAVQGSKAYAKCTRIPMPAGANAMTIPVDASDPYRKAVAPVGTSPAEGGQKTATKLQFAPRTLTLGKQVLYIPVTDELLQDAPAMDAFVRSWSLGKLAGILDEAVLVGGTGGLTAIVGDTGYCSTQTLSSTPTLAEVNGFVAKLTPEFRGKAEWYISVAVWSAIVGALATSANIQLKLIDPTPGAEKLVGLPVNIMPCLNAQVVLADMSQYVVVEHRPGPQIRVSEDIRFDYDESVYRLVARQAGAPAYKGRTAADGSVIGAFTSKA